jgi:DNA-binding response OmpR family regulator
MRLLSYARIAVVDADLAHRACLCSALSDLGMQQLLPADSPEEAQELAAVAPIDLCILDLRGFAAGEGGPKILANPFLASRTPGILIAADANRESIRLATRSGYKAVMAAPIAPRLLYRRIGSILQRARRASRNGNGNGHGAPTPGNPSTFGSEN